MCGTVDGGSAQQTDVIRLFQVSHQVVDEPGGRRCSSDAILGEYDDVEAPPRTHDATLVLEPAERSLHRDGILRHYARSSCCAYQ